MTVLELLEHFAHALADARDGAAARGLDAPIPVSGGQRVASVGTLHLYAFELPPDACLAEDVPVTIIKSPATESTEGVVVGRREDRVWIRTVGAVGETVAAATLVPNATGFFDTASRRLAEMVTQADAYSLGSAEGLLPWLEPGRVNRDDAARAAVATSVLTTLWAEEPAARRAKLAVQAIGLVRKDKRVLLISPDHRAVDEAFGAIARALRNASLPYQSLVSRYDMAVQEQASGIPLHELSFEAQTYQLLTKARAEKTALRRRYERYCELTPLFASKAEKQRDLDEVTSLEGRLLAQLSELQDKIKGINATLADYDTLPIWKRMAMQTVGKNVTSLAEYRTMYEQTVRQLSGELDVAKRRIAELTPEAAVPKELRREYAESKEAITRQGGSQKVQELLAAEEDTGRQAFIRNKRLVATTAGRVVTDPLFAGVRFDVLLADEAPLIPASFLLAAAALARERIVLSGDPRDIGAGAWQAGAGQWSTVTGQ